MDRYLLSFDFSEFVRQVENVRTSYKDLGFSTQQIFSSFSDTVKGLQKEIDSLSASIVNVSLNLDTTYSLLNAHMKESVQILSDLEKCGKGIGSINAGGTMGQVKDVYPGLVEASGPEAKAIAKAGEVAAEASVVAKQAAKQVSETKEEISKEVGAIGGIIEKELEGAKRGVGSALSGLMGPVSFGGGLIAGLISAMVLGVEYTQRIKAQAGELANVFESSVDGLGNKVTQKAIGWFSDFQEKAQKFFGVGRKEVQNHVAAFVNMGYQSEQFMKQFDKSLGVVGANIPMLTLSLEKHLNLASGSAAKNVNEMVSSYGDTLDDAADKFYKLSFAAQRSGIGVEKFIGSIMSGAQAMRQYGIDVNDVTQVMSKLQDYYDRLLGPDKKPFAGELAAGALGSVAGGMGRMDQSFEVAVAQKLFPELQGYGARQEYRSGLKRIAEDNDIGFMIRDIKAKVDVAREQVGNNDVNMAVFLNKFAGWDEIYAKDIIKIAPTLKEGVEIEGATKKQLEEFKKTYETEGKVLTDLQKNQEAIIKSLAKIGQGILKLLIGTLGALVVGFKTLFSLFEVMMLPKNEQREALENIVSGYSTQLVNVLGGAKESIEGVKELFTSLKKSGIDVAGDSLIKALEWEPISKDKEQKSAYVPPTPKFLEPMDNMQLSLEVADLLSKKDFVGAKDLGIKELRKRQALNDYQNKYAKMVDEATIKYAKEHNIPVEELQKSMGKPFEVKSVIPNDEITGSLNYSAMRVVHSMTW